jgi:glutamate racemase
MSAAPDPRTLAIGVFDSGVGGLTVVRALRHALPQEEILYLGDTARVPYGTKGPATILRYAQQAARFLVDRGVKLVAIACNTASVWSVDALRTSLEVPVVGAVEPGAEAAVAASRTGRIGVIGTLSTVRSAAYERAIAARTPECRVTSVACPLFVPLAEEGWLDGDVPRLVAERYLDELARRADGRVDVLVLGCTHYPLLRPLIARMGAERLGGEVTLIDSARAMCGRRSG